MLTDVWRTEKSDSLHAWSLASFVLEHVTTSSMRMAKDENNLATGTWRVHFTAIYTAHADMSWETACDDTEWTMNSPGFPDILTLVTESLKIQHSTKS